MQFPTSGPSCGQLRRRRARGVRQTDPGITPTTTTRSSPSTRTGACTSTGRSAASDAVYTAPFGLTLGLGTYYRSGAPFPFGWYNVFYPDLLTTYPWRGHRRFRRPLPATYEANISLGYTFNVWRVSIRRPFTCSNLLDRQAVTDISEDFTRRHFCLEAAGCTPANTRLLAAHFDRLGPVPFGEGVPDEHWAEPTLRRIRGRSGLASDFFLIASFALRRGFAPLFFSHRAPGVGLDSPWRYPCDAPSFSSLPRPSPRLRFLPRPGAAVHESEGTVPSRRVPGRAGDPRPPRCGNGEAGA